MQLSWFKKKILNLRSLKKVLIIEFGIKNFPIKKTQPQINFTGEAYQTCKVEIIPILGKLSENKGGNTPNPFMRPVSKSQILQEN